MNLTIYASGDSVFMQYCLNALAMLHGQGTLNSLALLGLMIGILVAVTSGIGQGGTARGLPGVFMGILMYMVLFVPTTTVTVISTHPTQPLGQSGTFTVANVPIGVAAAGSIVSNIGYNLSERLVQAYTLPGWQDQDLLQGGFDRSLDWLSIGWFFQNPSLNSADNTLSRFRTNLVSYMRSCTSKALVVDRDRVNKMMGSSNPFDTSIGFGFNSMWDYFDYTAMDNGAVTPMSCQTGATQIPKDQGQYLPKALPAAVGSSLNYSGKVNAGTDLNNAWNIYGANQTKYINFYSAQLINASLSEAMLDVPILSQNQIANAVMVNTAEQQRAEKYAGQESLFRRMVAPMMAFLECMVYIAAPFMAFGMCLGMFGVKAAFRYLSLAVSVAMWVPMMTAIDLYQTVRVMEALAPYLAGSGTVNGVDWQQFSSVSGAMTAFSSIDDIIATGSWLAISMPGLVIFAVFGSGAALNGVFSGMSGGDVINQKMAAPDPVSTPPAMDMKSPNTYSQASGAGRTGYAMPQISQGHSLSSAVSSDRVMSDSSTMGASLSAFERSVNAHTQSSGSNSGVQRSNATGVTVDSGTKFTSGQDGSHTATFGRDQQAQTGSTVDSRAGSDQSVSSQQSVGGDMGASAGMKGGKGAVGATAGASVDGKVTRGSDSTASIGAGGTTSTDKSMSGGESWKSSQGSGKQDVAGFMSRLESALSRFNGLSSQDQKSVEQAVGQQGMAEMRRAIGDVSSYRNAMSAERSSGASEQMGADVASQRYIANGYGGDGAAAASGIQQAYMDAGGSAPLMQDKMQALDGITDKNQRAVAATMLAMNEMRQGNLQSPGGDRAAMAMDNAYSKELSKGAVFAVGGSDGLPSAAPADLQQNVVKADAGGAAAMEQAPMSKVPQLGVPHVLNVSSGGGSSHSGDAGGNHHGTGGHSAGAAGMGTPADPGAVGEPPRLNITPGQPTYIDAVRTATQVDAGQASAAGKVAHGQEGLHKLGASVENTSALIHQKAENASNETYTEIVSGAIHSLFSGDEGHPSDGKK